MSAPADLCDADAWRVAVFAHPDDETLWAGGLMQRYPGEYGWTVICCSIPVRDPIRAYRFYDACSILGATGRVMPYPERRNEKHEHLTLLPDLRGAGVILTHGRAGEYGHPAHVELHHHLAKCYGPKVLAVGMRAQGQGEIVIRLDDAEWDRKLRALSQYRDPMNYKGTQMSTSEALLTEYGAMFDLRTESFDRLD